MAGGFVSQYTKCIVTGEAWGWRSVSQYTPLYCDRLRAGLAGDCVAIQGVVL